MKKIKFFSFASALMLAGAMGFSSCSSDSDVAETGGGVAGQTVKTQFAINIPYVGNNSSNNARPSTRMNEDNTQVNVSTDPSKFLGIENMQLFALKGEAGTSGATINTNINIGNGDNASSKDAWRTVYRDVAIPVGTDNFILYAKAGANSNKVDQSFQYGTLKTGDGYSDKDCKSLDKLTFNLQAINGKADFSSDQSAIQIADYLTAIAKASAEVPITSAEGAESTKTVSWATIKNETSYASENERNLLQKRYDEFIKLKAGSSTSVKATINGLLTVLGEENNAKPLTKAIIEKCKAVDLTNNTFPRNLNLPDGIANIKWNDSSKKFEYEEKTATGIGDNKIDYTKIAYPSALYYFVNSPAMVSDEELTHVSDLPDYTNWTTKPTDDATWTSSGFTKNAVAASTRAVALQKALQYSVANLKLSVKCSSAQLNDNAQQNGYAENNTIQLKNTGFPVTGVLVGGQPSKVQWNFLPASDVAFDYTIYDKVMNVKNENDTFYAPISTPSAYNYTLVLDNKKATGTQDNVYVIIELENNTSPFYGHDGLVPTGGTFYLMGKLELSNKKNENIDHIFVQDHTTEANLTITSLKNAYNCIPDLRTSQISLGLAVDLKWQEGLKFDIDL